METLQLNPFSCKPFKKTICITNYNGKQYKFKITQNSTLNWFYKLWTKYFIMIMINIKFCFVDYN